MKKITGFIFSFLVATALLMLINDNGALAQTGIQLLPPVSAAEKPAGLKGDRDSSQDIRSFLDISPPERAPSSSPFDDRSIDLPNHGDIEQPLKLYDLASHHFLYGRLIFEEPDLERHGIRKPPLKQLGTSTKTFILRGAGLPVILAKAWVQNKQTSTTSK